jgi:Zn-dependent protease
VALPALLLLFHAPFLFGYAKPVPVSFRRLGNPRRDMTWAAAAGPAMDLALERWSALFRASVLAVSVMDSRTIPGRFRSLCALPNRAKATRRLRRPS